MAKDVFDTSSAIELRDALNVVLLNSSRFNWKPYEALTQAYSVYLNILFREGDTSKDMGASKTCNPSSFFGFFSS